MQFSELKKNLKKDFSGLRKIKVTILGDSATQFLVMALRGHGHDCGYDMEIHEAGYDQIGLQIADPASELYKSAPEFVVLFRSTPKLLDQFYKTPLETRGAFGAAVAAQYAQWTDTVRSRLPGATIIILNFVESDDGVFGNFANKTALSFLFQLRSLNVEMMLLGQRQKSVYICDVAALASRVGSTNVVDARLYYDADLVFNLDFLPAIARALTQVIGALKGSFKKCLILDLDDTLWGGVIGDDGIQNIEVGGLGRGKAFSAFQAWAKELKSRGILLAVCSKNDEQIASEPFRSHPEMVLRLDDFAVFVATWDSKVQNIERIRAVLNISFDSMVFVDDNPYERGIVRHHLPDVTVPEMPADPLEYLGYLKSLNLFETASLTDEDRVRTEHFHEERKREVALKSFDSEDAFLESLKMTAEISSFDTFNIPRASQLILRSNQFNLRTVRYSEAELTSIAADPQWLHWAVSLQDKFGSYGLISVLMARVDGTDLFVDTWVMSCRVLKRGVEHVALGAVVSAARRLGLVRVLGEYRETPKNGLVKSHYANLGFTAEEGNRWSLDVQHWTPAHHHIQTTTRLLDALPAAVASMPA